MFVQWNEEKYGLGIPTIDNQHKELFRLTNEVHRLLMGKYNGKEAFKVVQQLYAYTGYHFTSEESILNEYGYPGLKNHMETHRRFRLKIKNELESVRDEADYPLAPLQSSLIEWIVKHIQGDDVKYARFFRESGINPEIHFSLSDDKRTDVIDQWHLRQLQLEIKGIDNQHKELIAILQQANDLQHTSENRRRLYIPVIIKKLYYYTRYHFSYEEEHMGQHNYPHLKSHHELHKVFIRRVKEFIDEYNRNKTDLTDRIVVFLKKWTVSHILKEDKKYKSFLINEKNPED